MGADLRRLDEFGDDFVDQVPRKRASGFACRLDNRAARLLAPQRLEAEPRVSQLGEKIIVLFKISDIFLTKTEHGSQMNCLEQKSLFPIDDRIRRRASVERLQQSLHEWKPIPPAIRRRCKQLLELVYDKENELWRRSLGLLADRISALQIVHQRRAAATVLELPKNGFRKYILIGAATGDARHPHDAEDLAVDASRFTEQFGNQAGVDQGRLSDSGGRIEENRAS